LIMDDFKYVAAADLKQACALLAQYGEEAKVLSGGQTLVNMMKKNLLMPSVIVDIKGLSELSYIRYDDETGMCIGGLTTHRALEQSGIVKEHYPMLAEMELNLASVAVRNWGTVGGSLCSADPASDLASCLMALGAELSIARQDGERKVMLEDFIVDSFETTIKPNEIMTQIRIPAKALKSGGCHIKFARRATDLGIVVVSSFLTLDDAVPDRCREIRIALGSIDPSPRRYMKAEDCLKGQIISDAIIDKAAQAVWEDCQPTSDINGSAEYKREVAKVMVTRSVKLAAARAGAR
jgi:aerobic carbon-monoxide dehydrogenase medium subunit